MRVQGVDPQYKTSIEWVGERISAGNFRERGSLMVEDRHLLQSDAEVIVIPLGYQGSGMPFGSFPK